MASNDTFSFPLEKYFHMCTLKAFQCPWCLFPCCFGSGCSVFTSIHGKLFYHLISRPTAAWRVKIHLCQGLVPIPSLYPLFQPRLTKLFEKSCLFINRNRGQSSGFWLQYVPLSFNKLVHLYQLEWVKMRGGGLWWGDQLRIGKFLEIQWLESGKERVWVGKGLQLYSALSEASFSPEELPVIVVVCKSVIILGKIQAHLEVNNCSMCT